MEKKKKILTPAMKEVCLGIFPEDDGICSSEKALKEKMKNSRFREEYRKWKPPKRKKMRNFSKDTFFKPKVLFIEVDEDNISSCIVKRKDAHRLSLEVCENISTYFARREGFSEFIDIDSLLEPHDKERNRRFTRTWMFWSILDHLDVEESIKFLKNPVRYRSK